MFKNKGIHLIIATVFTIFAFIMVTIFKEDVSIKIMPILSISLILIALFNGFPIYKKAIQALKYKIVGIDLLVTTAAIGALFIEEYWESIAVSFLFIFGAYLEAKTISKTRSSIASLIDLSPVMARVIRDDKEVMVGTDDVNINDTVLIKTGEKIAVDGTVVSGNGYIDEANITGESLPVFKDLDTNVYAGTILQSGYLEVKTSKVGKDTTFAKIIQMVEEAQDKKANSQKFIESFAKYYTPLIFFIAVLTLIITGNIRTSLTLLVIACPGALVIATPISIVAGIGNGAKRGLLFKGGNTLEAFYKADTIAFDKTGTLTEGKLSVSYVYSDSLTEEKLLEIAALGEIYSEHPIGEAIINEATSRGIDLSTETKLKEIVTGKGIIFSIGAKVYYLGNRELYNKENIDPNYEKLIQEQESRGRTTIILSDKKKILGIMSLSDKLRSDAIVSIKKLKKLGYHNLVMLTGDNELVAKEISSQLSLDSYYGGLLPEDKLTKINELKENNKNVIMIGDGVNDAPALANASLGVALGGLGKDIAMESADVVLMSGKLDNLVKAMMLSKAVKLNILQNLVFAIGVALFLLLGVMTNYVTLSIGMLVHEVSVVLVIINAMRLLKFNKDVKIDL